MPNEQEDIEAMREVLRRLRESQSHYASSFSSSTSSSSNASSSSSSIPLPSSSSSPSPSSASSLPSSPTSSSAPSSSTRVILNVPKVPRPGLNPPVKRLSHECKCVECGKVFVNFIKFNEHFSPHGPVAKFCEVCDKIFFCKRNSTGHASTF